jgi:hypothetical protein
MICTTHSLDDNPSYAILEFPHCIDAFGNVDWFRARIKIYTTQIFIFVLDCKKYPNLIEDT